MGGTWGKFGDDSFDNVDLTEISREMKKLQAPKEEVLLHSAGMRKIRDVSEKYAGDLPAPFPNIKIHVADWLKPDEMFMGPPEVIEKLLALAEIAGGERAREILLKICREDPSEESTDES
jgi:hypothetical protein